MDAPGSLEYLYAARGEYKKLRELVQRREIPWSLDEVLEGFQSVDLRTAETKQAVSDCCRAAEFRGHRWTRDDLYRVAWYGDEKTIRRILRSDRPPWDPYAIACAARHSDSLASLKILHEASPLTPTLGTEDDEVYMDKHDMRADPGTPCLLAIQGDNPAGLEYLLTRPSPYPLPPEPFFNAALEGSYDVLRLLKRRDPAGFEAERGKIARLNRNRDDPELATILA